MGGGSLARAGGELGAGGGPGRQCSDWEGRLGLVLLGREAGAWTVRVELPTCPFSLTFPRSSNLLSLLSLLAHAALSSVNAVPFPFYQVHAYSLLDSPRTASAPKEAFPDSPLLPSVPVRGPHSQDPCLGGLYVCDYPSMVSPIGAKLWGGKRSVVLMLCSQHLEWHLAHSRCSESWMEDGGWVGG